MRVQQEYQSTEYTCRFIARVLQHTHTFYHQFINRWQQRYITIAYVYYLDQCFKHQKKSTHCLSDTISLFISRYGYSHGLIFAEHVESFSDVQTTARLFGVVNVMGNNEPRKKKKKKTTHCHLSRLIPKVCWKKTNEEY